jgi:hypothetical protein
MDADYPVRLSVDYPDRDLNRLTSALRIFTVIPIVIVLGTIGGISAELGQRNDRREHGRDRRHRAADRSAAVDGRLSPAVPAVVV